MSKAKPLMIGAALGASAMFFAQQYHVIQSQDGLRVIPRTPQNSLGLAYVDIRNWGPSQWTDRPELARALMAHGSSDLISESVASSMADRISDETSTLDELRGFLNGVKDAPTSGADDSLLSFPSSRAGDVIEKTDGSDSDLFPIPYPQDAGTNRPADPFREARAEVNPEAVPARSGSRFSSDDVLDGLPSAGSQEAATRLADGSITSSPKSAPSTAELARQMEDRIFGKSSGSSTSTTAAKPVTTAKPKPVESDSMFEEVTTQLESRAQEALNRAQETMKGKAASSLESTTNASTNFVREKASGLVPDSAKSLLNGAASTAEKPVTASPLDFDPFLD